MKFKICTLLLILSNAAGSFASQCVITKIPTPSDSNIINQYTYLLNGFDISANPTSYDKTLYDIKIKFPTNLTDSLEYDITTIKLSNSDGTLLSYPPLVSKYQNYAQFSLQARLESISCLEIKNTYRNYTRGATCRDNIYKFIDLASFVPNSPKCKI